MGGHCPVPRRFSTYGYKESFRGEFTTHNTNHGEQYHWKNGSVFSVTLFGDSGCFLPLYVAPFSEEQIARIRRYQKHPDFIGVLCYSCVRKGKMIPRREGMQCPNCGVIYVWAYGLLSKEEAEEEAAARYNRPLSEFAGAAEITLRHWTPE